MAQNYTGPKFSKLTTLAGRAVYPHLHAPDTKFNEGGLYHTKLTLSSADAQPLIDAIDEAITQAVVACQEEKDAQAFKASNGKTKKAGKIKQADAPYKVDEESGDVTFNFKRNATKKDGAAISPPVLFDSKGKRLEPGTKIGGGSKLKVNFAIMPFPNYTPTIGMGVKLGLEAVQVVELQTFGGPSADRFGFDVIADDETPAEASLDTADVGAADDAEGDF